MRRAATLALALATFNWLLLPGFVHAQATEPDTDTDAYDQTTCQGVEEDDVQDVSHTAVQDPYGKTDLNGGSSQDLGQDSDEYSPFPKNNFWPTFNVNNSESSVSFEPNYTAEEDELANDAYMPEPDITFSQTGDAVPGSETTVLIKATGFTGKETTVSDLYFASWLDGRYFNGQLAGGEIDAYDEQTSTTVDPGRPDCGAIGRGTQVDQDGDGMDDNWELRFGFDPTDSGDAGADPDNDGFVADDFPNKAGELVSPVPLLAGGELGDGQFTNLEEYILGTNPTVADSDGDGFFDEQDAVGLGQNLVSFEARKDPSAGPYVLHSIVAGVTQKKDEDKVRLVKIDSNEYLVLQHGGEALSVALRVITPGVRAGEVLEVEALPAGSSTPDLLGTYRWLVNGDLLTNLSGQSKRTLRYIIPEGTRAGTTFLIEVEAIDPKNGQLARGRTSVVIGDTVLLSFDPLRVDVGSTVEIRALLSSGLDPQDHLFVWSVDDVEKTSDSRVGADVLSLVPEVSGGEMLPVAVSVLDRRSREVGNVRTEILVQRPTVQIELTPAAPAENQQVTARAAVEHFGNATLGYEFTVDDQIVVSPGPTVTFSAGPAGSGHNVAVMVRASDTTNQSASAQVSFTTLPAGRTAGINNAGSRPRLLAQVVVGSQQSTGYVALSAVVALGLGVVVARRTKRANWKLG